VARQTGVAVATLRAWEDRYGLLRPARTGGGHRRYRDEDVRRVLAVLELAQEGWTVGAAARWVGSRPASTAVAHRRQFALATTGGDPPDPEVLVAAHEATRALLYITAAREATDILAATVERLGGWTAPAREAGGWALPVDLAFGEGEPVLPVAEPLSIARLRLEQLMPGLVEDARRAVHLLRRSENLDD
jgi:DNA-binding transcriptional MerR regulator